MNEEAIAWLNSARGRYWSRQKYEAPHYQAGVFAEVKEDPTCEAVDIAAWECFNSQTTGLGPYGIPPECV